MKKTLRSLALSLTVTVAATSAVAAPPATAQSSSSGSSASSGSSRSSGSSGSSGGSRGPQNKVEFGEDRVDGPLVITVMGDLLGQGISENVGFLIGDLGIMVDIGVGEEFAILFGDSWRGPGFAQGEWMSPVGVVAVMGEDGRIRIVRPLNDGDRVEQLIDYAHRDGLTLIPSDVININGTLYLQGMWNRGIGNVLRTEIWRSTDQGATWTSLGTTPASHMKGMGNLITWENGPDGYVYVMSSAFKRADDVYLSRVRPEQIADRGTWEHYNATTGTWSPAFTDTPVLSKKVAAGEMSLRYIEGHWVLAMFNAETYSVEVRITRNITDDWNAITPAKVILGGAWGAPQDAGNFAQVYGGYIVPGSTIGNMDLVVSQWNTGTNKRYNSTQFNVTGLDKFFGIGTTGTPADAPQTRMAPQTTQLAPESRVGDQSVITVRQTEVTADATPDQGLVDSVTDLLVVPLGQD